MAFAICLFGVSAGVTTGSSVAYTLDGIALKERAVFVRHMATSHRQLVSQSLDDDNLRKVRRSFVRGGGYEPSPRRQKC